MSFIIILMFSPKLPVPQFCQSSISYLLTPQGTQLQHIEGQVLKDNNPYSAHNFGSLCLSFFSSELWNLWVVPENIKMIIVSIGPCPRGFKILSHNTVLVQVLHATFHRLEKYRYRRMAMAFLSYIRKKKICFIFLKVKIL